MTTPATPTPDVGTEPPTAPTATIERTSWAGTAAFAVTAIAAAATSAEPDAVRTAATVVALALFTAGIVAFLWAYAIAIGRSRTVAIGIGGLYFLAGATAPTAVKRHLLGSLAVQTTVALATAAARPFTSLAFGILVPMFGLGLAGLWGAKHGRFEPRTDASQRARGSQVR